MFELTSEAIILLLRMALVAILYLFVAFVVLAAGRDLRRAARLVPAGRAATTPARLVVVDPGATTLATGEVLPLRSVTRLGRSSQSTILLDDTFVSSDHAVIVQRDGGWWLADCGSTNGTAVNDRPVHGEVSLAPGDVVAIGDVRLRIVP
jgi:hypothetical protein